MTRSRYGKVKIGIAGITAAGVMAGGVILQPGYKSAAVVSAPASGSVAVAAPSSGSAPAANVATSAPVTTSTARVSRGS